MRKEEWNMIPKSAPPVGRNCSGCGRKTGFMNSGNFRVNANGSRIDVWLIYRCEKCGTSWNMDIYSRTPLTAIDKGQYESFLWFWEAETADLKYRNIWKYCSQNTGMKVRVGGAMGDKFLIRKDIDAYMADLKRWLLEAEEVKLEEMTGFFAARVDQYEEHMAIWKKAYRHMGMLVPKGIQTLLDLGCGTGLELEDILCSQPRLHVTGIDLSSDMLGKLQEKFPQVKTICADYFSCELGEKTFDAAVSFETLHHFKPEKKKLLFEKIRRSLKPGGIYI